MESLHQESGRQDSSDRNKLKFQYDVQLSTSSEIQYTKYVIRSGTVEEGKDYEIKLLALMSLRCIDETVQKLFLLSNAEVCGDFDDIGIYRVNQEGQRRLYLMQVKHKVKPTKITVDEFRDQVKKKDFSLKKYGESYQKISENKFNLIKTLFNDEINDDEIEFILYTNRFVDNSKFLETHPNEPKFLITKTSSENTVFRFGTDNFPDIDKSFLSKLVIFTKQCNCSELDDLIYQEIKKIIPELLLSKTKDIVKSFVEFIRSWANGKLGGSHMLDKNRIINKLLELVVYPYIFTIDESINDNFSCDWNLFYKILKSHSTIIIESDQTVTDFLISYINSRLGINSTFWNIDLRNQKKFFLDICPNLQYEIVDSPTLNTFDFYIALWQQFLLPLIIVIKDKEYLALMKFLSTFKPNLQLIVLINSSIMNKSGNFLTNLSQLNEQLKELMCKQHISFQNRKNVSLNDIIDGLENVQKLISIKDIIHMLCGKFVIGPRIQSLPTLHIPDQILSKVSLSFGALKTKQDTFIVYSENETDFKWCLDFYKLRKQCFICNDYELAPTNLENSKCLIILSKNNFSNLRSKVANRNTHYVIAHLNGINKLKKDIAYKPITGMKLFIRGFKNLFKNAADGYKMINNVWLEWVRSEGCIENIRTHRTNLTEQKKIKELLNNSINVITAAPGMGKSVMLDYISSIVSVDNWVLKINLNQYTNYYRQEAFRKISYENHLLYFNNQILKSQNQNNSFNLFMFKKKYFSRKHVLLLFDGVDEISPTFNEEVTAMISSIHENGFKIIITTRPVTQYKIEKHFNAFSNVLHPFTSEQQLQYFQQYFDTFSTDSNVSNVLINKYVLELFEVIKQTARSSNLDFLGIPLHCKITSETMSSNYQDYAKDGELNLIQNFDVLSLYKKFIRDKYDILMKKLPNDSTINYRLVEEYYMLLGLQSIFDESDLKGLDVKRKVQHFKENIFSGYEKFGFISLEDNMNLTFIHRTISEYFAGKWIYRKLKEKLCVSICHRLLKKSPHSHYQGVHNFFDRHLLRKYKLLNAVMTRQVNQAAKLLEENSTIINEVDDLERNALHIIARWGSLHPIPIIDNAMGSAYDGIEGRHSAVSMTKLLINRNISFKKDIFDFNPSDYAMSSNSLDILNQIINKFKYVKLKNVDINSYLYYAAKYGYSHLLAKIFSLNFNRRHLSHHFNEILHLATGPFYKLAIIKCLITEGANVNAVGSRRWTPLHCAASHSNAAVVQYLISAGADYNAQTDLGLTPFLIASAEGKVSILKHLNSLDVDITQRDTLGFTAIHHAAVSADKETIEYLISIGLDYNSRTVEGYTPFLLAAASSKLIILEYLASLQANINETNNYDETVVQLTSLKDNKYLKSISCNYKSKTNQGDTSRIIVYAQAEGPIHEMQDLGSMGVNIHANNYEGFTAIHLAAAYADEETVEYLISIGFDCNSKLNTTDRNGKIKTIKHFIFKDANIKVKDNDGLNVVDLENEETSHLADTPFLIAAQNSKINILKYFVSKGVNVNQKNDYGYSAIHYAATFADKETAEYLVSIGVDYNSKTNEGYTPFLLAIWKSNINTLKYLVSVGANVDDKINEYSAIHFAAARGSRDTVEHLMTLGFNCNFKTDLGWTPLLVAAECGNIDTLPTA